MSLEELEASGAITVLPMVSNKERDLEFFLDHHEFNKPEPTPETSTCWKTYGSPCFFELFQCATVNHAWLTLDDMEMLPICKRPLRKKSGPFLPPKTHPPNEPAFIDVIPLSFLERLLRSKHPHIQQMMAMYFKPKCSYSTVLFLSQFACRIYRKAKSTCSPGGGVETFSIHMEPSPGINSVGPDLDVLYAVTKLYNTHARDDTIPARLKWINSTARGECFSGRFLRLKDLHKLPSLFHLNRHDDDVDVVKGKEEKED